MAFCPPLTLFRQKVVRSLFLWVTEKFSRVIQGEIRWDTKMDWLNQMYQRTFFFLKTQSLKSSLNSGCLLFQAGYRHFSTCCYRFSPLGCRLCCAMCYISKTKLYHRLKSQTFEWFDIWWRHLEEIKCYLTWWSKSTRWCFGSVHPRKAGGREKKETEKQS